MANQNKHKILFLCTGNACRSQMAEGWAKELLSGICDAYSAGVSPHKVDPNAISVMAEAGVDISSHYSKHIDDLNDIDLDYVITVCGYANEQCPVFPGKVNRIHHGFDDPPSLAYYAKTDEEAIGHYRRVRDEIKEFIKKLPDLIK